MGRVEIETPLEIDSRASSVVLSDDLEDVLIVENLEQNREENREQKLRNLLVENSRKLLGTPYGLGEESTTATDCSGLVYQVCRMSGIPISRGTTRTMRFWDRAKIPLAGDCPMFDYKGRATPTHIGIWVDPMDVMIHSGTSTGVIETDIKRYWGKNNRYKFSVIIPSI